MHLAGTGDLQPAAAVGTRGEHHVDLGGRFREREERRAESHDQIVAFKEATQEIGVHALQVGKRDVLGDPEPFHLVEHGRVRGVAVDAIGAPGRDDLDGRLVHAGITHLHGAGVRAQQQRQTVRVVHVDVERVLHRTRRMVQRVVQCGEIGPVVFHFGAVGHVKANGTEDFFHAFPGPDHRMDTARRATAAREGDVNGFGCQTGIQLRLRQFGTARGQKLFDLLLGLVDSCAGLSLLLGIELAQAFEQHRQGAFLAQEASFCVLKRGGIRSRGEPFLRLGYQVVNQSSHEIQPSKRKRGHYSPVCSDAR